MNFRALFLIVAACSLLHFTSHAAIRYLSITGSNSNPGTYAQPWGTFVYAINSLNAGDTLYIFPGVYNCFAINHQYYKSGVSIIGIAPGVIIDGTYAPFQDTTLSSWTLWDAAKNIYRSSSPLPSVNIYSIRGTYRFNTKDYQFATRRYANFTYGDLSTDNEDAVTSGNLFVGPGLYWDDNGGVDAANPGRVYVRMKPSKYMTPQESGFPSDPNKIPLRINAETSLLALHGCSNILFKNITFRGFGFEIYSSCSNLTFKNLVMDGHARIVISYDGQPQYNIAIDSVNFLYGEFNWVAWTDVKIYTKPGYNYMVAGLQIGNNAHHVEVKNCLIKNYWGGFYILGYGNHHINIHDNQFLNIRDDLTLSTAAYEIDIHHNRMIGPSAGVSRYAVGNSGNPGKKYIHHNIIDCSMPQRGGRAYADGTFASGWNGPNNDGMVWLHPFETHNASGYGSEGDPRMIYNNTIIAGKQEYAGVNYGLFNVGPRNTVIKHRAYNNICIQVSDGYLNTDDVFTDGSMDADGNLFYRMQTSSLPLWKRVNGSQDFYTFSAFQSATGFENNGVYADPQLDANYMPWSNSACGGINIASLGLNLPLPDALIYRGALVPPCLSGTMAVGVTSSNVTCNGGNNGSASANVSGGTSPYTYSWSTSPAQNTQTATGLCAGNYVCTVTDGSGSTATANVTITQPAVLTAAATATAATCGNNNGNASVTAGGGTPNYTYSWSPSGGNSSAATGLGAGNYTCTVTDSKGCTKTSTVQITSTGGPSVTTSSTPQTCAVGGTATANPLGGTAPYTYQWCNGQTTSTATNLSAGSCTVIVTDAGGCATTSTVTITASGSIPTATVAVTVATCGNNNGTATANVSGGTSPYTYNWSSGASTSSATGLAGGNYTVTITDATGCTAVQTVNISQTSAVTATTASTPSACNSNNGTATVTAGAGTSPYTYLWNPSGQTTSSATGLSAGTYTVTVADNTGCTKTATMTVTQTGGPTATAATTTATITQGQTTTLTANGGGTYQWSNGSTQNSISVSPTATTVYCVTVTDASNCTDTACVTVTVKTEPIPCGNIFVPNAFSPNSDGQNEMECVLGGCIQTLIFTIYDRWGEKVFEYSGSPLPSGGAGGGPCWDGMFKGKLLNTATFVYYLQATLTNGELINKKGNISLIR